MMENNIEELLKNALENLWSEFQENELLDSLIAGKNERAIQNKLFRILNKESKLNVSREYKKVDLAFMRGDKTPYALVELKLYYTFDVLPLSAKDSKCILKDEITLKELGMSKDNLYTILFLISFDYSNLKIKKEMPKTYEEKSEKKLKICKNNWKKVEEEALNSMNNFYKDKNVIKYGVIEAGEAFGTKVSILYWLVKVQ